jgi:AsmA protein
VRVLRWFGWFLLAFFAVALILVLSIGHFKGPITRAISNATGREIDIDGDLRVVPSLIHPTFRADHVRVANAEWGQYDYLLQADRIEASVSLAGLFIGRVIVPDVRLEGAALALEIDKDGRKNWILRPGEEEKKKESRIFVRHLTLDHGRLLYEDAGREISLAADLDTDAQGVAFNVEGKYQGMPAKASGHGGPVLALRDTNEPYPLKGSAKIGDTSVDLDGNITALVDLSGIDTRITLAGKSMDDLYRIIGVALPKTSPYTTSGRLVRDGKLIRYQDFTGKVGESDLAGTFQFDAGRSRPLMEGDLQSKVLNLADLGSLVGTGEEREHQGVLPDMSFDPSRWDSVDADVKLRSGTIKRPKQLPIENLAVHILMKDKVLSLEPLDFGIAGGRLRGPVRMDGRPETIASDMALRVDKLQLAKLFPTLKGNEASLGTLGGAVELKGHGNSVKDMLGTSNGKIALYMDGGRISGTLMELVALDLWNAARLKLEGDKPIDVRCAIADLDVKDGVAKVNAMVIDTSVVNVQAGGTINLKTEQMNLQVNPTPKNKSLASLNSPIYVRGTFSAPSVSLDSKAAAKGIGAIVMGVINPLLAIIPLINEGPGKDSPCGQLITEALAKAKPVENKAAAAISSDRSAASGATARRPRSQSAR